MPNDEQHPLGENVGFVMLPEQLMDECPDPMIWAVFAVIYKKANGNKKGCFCSTKTLSQLSGVGINNVRKCTRWLFDHGYLKAVKRPNDTTLFYAYPFRATPREVENTPSRNREASRNHEYPPHEIVSTPLTKSLDKQDPSNKIPLTRETPLSPPKGGETRKKSKPEKFVPTEADLPIPLRPIADQAIQCWLKQLRGKKTRHAFNVYAGQLAKIHADPRGGEAALLEQFENAELAKATGSGWTSITFKNWQAYGLANKPRLANNGAVRPGPPLKELVM